jgi:hypothetical protein
MKRSLAFGVIVIAVVGLLGGSALLIAGQSRVSQDAIQSSVTRTPELIDSAWKLPVAATFNTDVTWQSNGSRCGPASVANTFRSIGEQETTEAEVLAGTGKCWTGFCIIGLTLESLPRSLERTPSGRSPCFGI